MSLTGPNKAALDTALGEYLGWVGDPVATLQAAVAEDEKFLLGHSTIAALNCLGGATGDSAPVRAALAAAEPLAATATPQERLHLAAAMAWAEGDITGAAAFWEAALKAEPDDILALRLAHDTHFFLGDAQKLRDVPLAVLPAYTRDRKARGHVLGMAAFGLEETGDYAAAERAGREAVEIDPADSWAVHAVAHVLEMQDRPEEGVKWMRGLEPHWAPATGLAVHQWWHLALYLIELGRFDEVLAIYDEKIRGSGSAIILDLVDAAALLWRLKLLGVELGSRWAELAPVWAAYAEDHVLAFNDVHIGFTLAAAGDMPALERLAASLENFAQAGPGTNARISAELGLPVLRAMQAFAAGDDAVTVALLAPIRHRLAEIGGSNAQRDLFIQTLGLAACRAGQTGLFAQILAERLQLKQGTPLAWGRVRAR